MRDRRFVIPCHLLEVGASRVEPVVEAIHDVKAGALVGAWVLDFRYAFRLLGRSPMFTAFAVASLTLGIGAAGAIFQLFDAIVLRKLPVPESNQLVLASFGGPNGRFNYSMPYPHFEEIRRRTTTLSGIFATNPFDRVNVTYRGEPDVAQGIYVGSRADYLRMSAFITLHRLRPVIEREFPLAEYEAALKLLESGNFVGKIILTL